MIYIYIYIEDVEPAFSHGRIVVGPTAARHLTSIERQLGESIIVR